MIVVKPILRDARQYSLIPLTSIKIPQNNSILMAYSENLAGKIRQALAHLPAVEEKKMFGGIAFMVDGKMCLTASADRMMCRVDPNIHEEAIKRKGCCTVIMKGREYKGMFM